MAPAAGRDPHVDDETDAGALQDRGDRFLGCRAVPEREQGHLDRDATAPYCNAVAAKNGSTSRS